MRKGWPRWDGAEVESCHSNEERRSGRRPTQVVHDWLAAVLAPGDVVIDATAGNGHDTLQLVRRVAPTGRVIAIDVQESALAATRARVETAGLAGLVTFCHGSHGDLERWVEVGSVAAVMFNLGYLPGGDVGITTRLETTLQALEAAARVLRPGGWLTVVCYPGHEEGAREAPQVESFFQQLSAVGWRISQHRVHGTLRPAPFALGACRLEISNFKFQI